jgi:hypothetical protein
MPNFGTYYIDAPNFIDATTITDAAGVVAPDGIYQFNGVYREMVSGVLSSVITYCDSCCESCSAIFVYPINATKRDYHKMCSNVGESTGTAIIIKFKFNENRLGYMQGLQATYDGSVYSGVVSNRYGLLEKKYVGNVGFVSASDIVNDPYNPYSLTVYNWQSTSNQFIQSGQNPITETIALTDINQVTTTSANIYNNPDECYLLVPKTSLVTTVDAEVYSPHRQIDSSGGACSITIPCPSPLSRFSGTAMAASASAACSLASSSGLTNAYFLMRVNSTSGSPRLFDRVYLDAAGENALTTAGYYAIQNAYSGTTETYSWIHVDSDGIVQAAGSCGSPMLTEMISSQVRGSFWQACEYQNINGVNLPDQQYWHGGSGDAPQLGDNVYSDVLGTTYLPDGWYQLMREYIRIEVSSGAVITIQNCTI